VTAEQLESTRDDVHRLLAAARPSQDVDDPETWPQYRLIWPHLEPTRAAGSQREAVRQLIIDRVRYLYLRAGLDRGHSLAAEVQDRWEAMEQMQATQRLRDRCTGNCCSSATTSALSCGRRASIRRRRNSTRECGRSSGTYSALITRTR